MRWRWPALWVGETAPLLRAAVAAGGVSGMAEEESGSEMRLGSELLRETGQLFSSNSRGGRTRPPWFLQAGEVGDVAAWQQQLSSMLLHVAWLGAEETDAGCQMCAVTYCQHSGWSAVHERLN